MRNLLRSNNRTRRHTAWMMLSLCLFTMVSGVASACALEARGGHSHGASAAHMSTTPAALETAQGNATGTGHDEHDTDTQPTKESCLKACDAESQTLLKQPPSLDSPHLAPGPFTATAWVAEVHNSNLVGRAHDLRLHDHGAPVRVLFARLAL